MVKSILKINSNLKQHESLSSSSSTQVTTTTTTTKNVRFDLLSTTIKRFNSNDEPITISNDYHCSSCSPDIDANGSITTDIYNQGDYITDEPCWFNNLDVLPNLINFDKKFHTYYQRYKMTRSNLLLSSSSSSSSNQFRNFYKENDLSLSDLDYDDDITIDTLENSRFTGLDSLDKDTTNDGCLDTGTDDNDFLISNSDIKWELVASNIPKPSQSLDLLNDQSIQSFLNGQNIKLYNLEQLNGNKMYGSLIVNNIDFEKIVEVKFTFNHWSNIHYINSSYCKSLTPRFDQFQFVIDLNRYKFFLQIKDLLNKQIIIEFYCRYDVGNQTYFDNNNYSNYTLTLLKTESSDLEKNNNVTTTPPVESLPFEHTTDLSLSSSSSSVSKSECMDSQYFPKDNAPPQKNNDNCTDSYVSNSKDTNHLNESGRKISAGTRSTQTNNTQHNHPFLVNNKYVVPMTSKQFMNNRNICHTRTFSEDTDYYNTSPLKHLYHNDTCQFVKKPATKNEVLHIEPNPLPLDDLYISTTTTTTTKFEVQSNDVPNKSLSSKTNRLKFSEEEPKQAGNLPDLTDRLENKIFSTPPLSSTSSTISRLNPKNKKISSLPSGSVITVTNTNTNSNNNIKLDSTDLKENEPEAVIDNVDHISNRISGQNSGLSSKPPLTGGSAKDLPHIGKPTLDHFNNDSSVHSISLGYKPELERQNKVQSKRTDTIYKSSSITFNNNSHRDKSDNLIIPKSKSLSSLDNIATVHVINNSKSFNALADISNSSIDLSNRIHDNSSTKRIQNNPLKSMDYQTLLQCYCFYKSPPLSNKASVSCYSEMGLSSSPSATLFL